MQSLIHINRYKVIFPGHDNGQNVGQKVTDKNSHVYYVINIDSCFKEKSKKNVKRKTIYLF